MSSPTVDSSGSSFPGPAIAAMLWVVAVVVIITVFYFMALKGCQNLSGRMQDLGSEPAIVDDTVYRFLQNMAKESPHHYTSQQLEYYTRSFSHKLGSGGFGVVYRGDLQGGVPLAVKVLNNNLAKRLVEEQVMAEVSSIGRTYHLNLVKLYGYCFEPKLKALVYEFMPNGSLDTVLFGDIQTELDWGKRHNIALGTAKGLAYLHEECEQKIIHHDIKPGNVLLDSSMNPKVADFGLARLSNKDSSHVAMSGFKGTPGYAAPELWTPSTYVTRKCDVYSFGMMLFEIIGMRRNHVAELSGTSEEWLPRWTYQKLIKDGVEAAAAEMVAVAGDEQAAVQRALKVALWCVQHAPRDRPDMSTVVRMLGVIEVSSPPNPFDHLEETFEFRVADSRNSTTSSNTVSTMPRSTDQDSTVGDETRIDVDRFLSC